jgi:endonuclease-8
MPEGPSIVILKEQVQTFKGQKIFQVSTKNDSLRERLQGQTVIDFKSWGKHFLICFEGFFVRIHLLMFGKYLINEEKESAAQLSLKFKEGQLNFYTSSIRLVDENVDDVYDWEKDVMSDQWNPKKAQAALKKLKKTTIADALLDQEIFAGVGNIIKNEILFRTKVQPDSEVQALPLEKVKALVKDARDYSFDFYKWKKLFQLKEHWLVYRKSVCPRCKHKITMKHTGVRKRRSFFCTNCQLLYKKTNK